MDFDGSITFKIYAHCTKTIFTAILFHMGTVRYPGTFRYHLIIELLEIGHIRDQG
jgi:hypothetical protein